MSACLSGTATVSLTFRDATFGGGRTSVLEQNQGSTTKHPNPQGLVNQTFLLGYNAKAVQEVLLPLVNHLQTSFSSWLMHKPNTTSTHYFLILFMV